MPASDITVDIKESGRTGKKKISRRSENNYKHERETGSKRIER